MKTKHSEQSRSIRTFLLFCLIVGSLIIASLTYKFITVLGKSVYDGNQQIIVEHYRDEKNIAVYAFTPQKKTVATVVISGKKDGLSLGSLGIPVEGYIRSSKKLPLMPVAETLFQAGIGYTGIETNLTFVDIVRLLLFTKTTRSQQVEEVSLDDAAAQLAKPVRALFLDQTVIDEGKTVAVINATGVSGVGRHLEQLLTTMGINVISITTAKDIEKTTSIVTSEENSYTKKRLERIFGLQATLDQKQTLSDILITVGTDSLKHRLLSE